MEVPYKLGSVVFECDIRECNLYGGYVIYNIDKHNVDGYIYDGDGLMIAENTWDGYVPQATIGEDKLFETEVDCINYIIEDAESRGLVLVKIISNKDSHYIAVRARGTLNLYVANLARYSRGDIGVSVFGEWR